MFTTLPRKFALGTGESLTLSPDYESAEPSFPPPDFSPPEYSPPPLPITVKQDLVHDPDYEEVDRTRPSSVNELSSPRGEYGYMIPSPSVEMARSVPASPVSSISSTGSFKPARAAPPPPSGKKKPESAKQLEYENTAVSNT
ncbi:uncharacterized protein [Diadema antillarum]|uniref:uncharacterized protein n=1 Tax=Diadema antillarum TaxID=105358 RepID=UPI003A8575DF